MTGLIDRTFFFDHARASLFDGHLRQKQVDGLNVHLDRCEAFHRGDDRRWLAYILATTHHETGRRFQPVEEIGRGKGRPYGAVDAATGKAYYGRGYVQLTWKDNYRKMGDILGHDLVHHPEEALQPAIAVRILFYGMTNGTFRKHALAEYFHGSVADWHAARNIVNAPSDSADLVAGYAKRYYAAICVPVG